MTRLLVAEDEDGTRLSLTHALRREGYVVDEAATAWRPSGSGSVATTHS